jgi:hypothetical protein
MQQIYIYIKKKKKQQYINIKKLVLVMEYFSKISLSGLLKKKKDRKITELDSKLIFK